MKTIEANFDGLVGPTHNYAGLSIGNKASLNNAQKFSDPKAAAIQGLAKMKTLYDLGMVQGVLAPQERPDLYTLSRFGFTGNEQQVLNKTFKYSPELLSACYSASSMWAANAATVSPSADTFDGKIHFTPANLINKFHRSLEVETTANILQSVFSNSDFFSHHNCLNKHNSFSDEGAANHTRLKSNANSSGIEIFTFGRSMFNSSLPLPNKYPARQTLEACQAIARLHGLSPKHTFYVQQNPKVIDQGVFHNDVIAVGNQNVLFYHEEAYINSSSFIKQLSDKFLTDELCLIEVTSEDVSVTEAVSSYLFNTQLITLPSSDMALIAPQHCQESTSVKDYLDKLLSLNTPIKSVCYVDVNESMKNGGGPACLRLRVVLNAKEQQAVNQHCLLNNNLYRKLCDWVNKHYRDRLSSDDFRDINLLNESRAALDELTQLLQLGSIYRFQQI